MASTEKRGDLGRVVVIGGNGFLGHHIVNQALASWNAASVSSIDVRCVRNVNEAASYHECDITDAPKLTALLRRIAPDVVIHTASPTASTDSKVANELFRKVNVDGTRAVIEACREAGVKALVYTSSASVISDNSLPLHNADEAWPVIRGAQQKEYYSETKAAAEELVIKANLQEPSKLLTTSIRPAGIFGEGDVQTFAGFLQVYRTGKSRLQLGDNTNLFDFTYVGNVAHAHLLAARLLLATATSSTLPLDHERVDGEVFFVTNDSPVYFWDFARAVYRAGGSQAGTDGLIILPRGFALGIATLAEVFMGLIGKRPTFTRLRASVSSTTRYYNISKAKQTLRYTPLWTLQEGLDRSVAWFLEQEKAAEAEAVKA